MIADIINGAFELFGGALTLLNVRQILRDRRIAGVHWLPTGFFTAWGLWNLYFYPSLGQWFSFAGGCVIVIVNLWWLFLIARYWKHPT